MGLFKNGVLIDVIGTFNGGTANFAADETLRRKPSISAPNIIFNKTAEWDLYAKDTCNGLGSHALATLSTVDLEEAKVTIYPNPSNGSVKINFENANENYDVQIFSVLGQKVFEKSFREIPSAAINNLQKGIYFVKITNNSQSVTKKLIVN